MSCNLGYTISTKRISHALSSLHHRYLDSETISFICILSQGDALAAAGGCSTAVSGNKFENLAAKVTLLSNRVLMLEHQVD